MSASASAAVIDVETRSDEYDNDGECSLREAVQASAVDALGAQVEPGCATGSGHDTITLHAGAPYTLTIPPGVGDIATGDLDLFDTDGVTLLGEGRTTTSVDGGDLDRILEGINGSVTVNSLTLTNGREPTGGAAGGGGGIISSVNVQLINAGVVGNETTNAGAGGGLRLIDEAALTASGDTVINDNVSNSNGGGISKIDDGDITLNPGVSVNGNDAVEFGAGMFISGNTDLVIDGASVSNNDLTEGLAFTRALGAAIWEQGNSFQITNAQITGNDAVADRAFGALELTVGAASTIDSSTISGNTVTGQDDADFDQIGSAAGRFNASAGATISNSTIANNTAVGADSGDTSDGAGFSTITPLTITGSTFSGNTLTGTAFTHFAGALFIDTAATGPTKILNSTFTDNAAPSAAGAIHAQSGSDLTVVHSTFSGNDSPQGAAINHQGGAQADIVFRGTIFDDGTGACVFGGGPTVTTNGFNVDAGESCVQATDDSDFENTDATLGALASNGGPTQTMALLGPTNLFDAAGACTGLDGVTPLTVDQRGYPRPFGSGCEPGAYEPYTCNGTVVNTPGLFPGCPLSTNPSVPPLKKKKKCKRKKKRSTAGSAAKKKCKKKKRKKK